MEDQAKLSVMTFSWNTQGVKICETLSANKASKNRSGIKGKITRKGSCALPEFFNELVDLIKSDGKNPEILAISTQADPSSGTYFHSEILQGLLPDHGYELLTMRDAEADGISSKWSHMRTSIFCREDVIDLYQEGQKLDKKYGKTQLVGKCRKPHGSVLFILNYLNKAGHGTLALISCFISKTGVDSSRMTSQKSIDECVGLFLEKTIDMKPYRDNCIIFGDFGETIKDSVLAADDIEKGNFKALLDLDPLYKRFKIEDDIYRGFEEGVEGSGPTFAPDFQLERDRNTSCRKNVKSSCYASGANYSWRSRVIYCNMVKDKPSLKCLYYDRFDSTGMEQSENAGIVSYFET